MKRMLKMLCLSMIVIGMLSINVSAASFKFTFTNSGTDYSNAASKGSKSFAAVTVSQAGNYTYKYSVARGVYTDYVAN